MYPNRTHSIQDHTITGNNFVQNNNLSRIIKIGLPLLMFENNCAQYNKIHIILFFMLGKEEKGKYIQFFKRMIQVQQKSKCQHVH